MRKKRRRIGFVVSVVLLAALATSSVPIERAVRDVARSEGQAAAAAAALAGADSFLMAPDDEALARATAIEYLSFNSENPHITLRPEDVQIDLEEGTIHVQVEARAYGLPVMLAWLVGVDDVNVTVTAAAEAQAVRRVQVGLNADGYPMSQCEGTLKTLKLISQ